MKNKVDLYNYEKQLKQATARVKRENISEKNKKAILEFVSDRELEGLSKARLLYFINRLLVISRLFKKDFEKADKEDIKMLVKKINKKDYTERTKKDYRVVIKKFYKWVRGIDEKGVYPEEVRWIPTTFNGENHFLPEELLKEEEINKLIELADHPRDKALVMTIADSGCRIGEILSMKIKNLSFDKYSAVLIVNGKTGMRRVRVIGATPYLAKWLETHPDKKNPDAPLWIVRGTTKEFTKREKKKKFDWSYSLSYPAVSKMLRKLAVKAGIKKKVNPHSFRHARATFLASRLTESQLKEMFGWAQSSRMAAIYVHMSGRDTDKALLNAYGITAKEQKEESKFTPKKCLRCSKENPATARICETCGAPLNLKTAIELDQKENKMTNLIIKMAQVIEKNSKEKIHFGELDFIIQPNKKNLKTIKKVK